MRCNWLLAYPGRRGKRVFEGCFNTLEAAEKKAERLNPAHCHDPKSRGACWRPVFNPPPGVPLRGPGNSTFKVIVKGDKKNATRAAQRHGVTLRACQKHPRFNEVICDAPCGQYRGLAKWLAERQPRGSTRAGRGGLPGSLLFFSGCDR